MSILDVETESLIIYKLTIVYYACGSLGPGTRLDFCTFHEITTNPFIIFSLLTFSVQFFKM